MLELHVASIDASNGNIPVSWTLSKELIAHLKKKDLKDPAVVILVVPQRYTGDDTDRNREYRKVVRLQELMTYIELPFAGTNKLMAIIDDSSSFKDAKNLYMGQRTSGGYSHDILDYNKEQYQYKDDMCHAAPITLEVPNAIFAKEPAKWEKAWVNWMSSSKAQNQCDFRRKRLFAYTIQPILFLMGYAGQIVASILALLFGAKSFSFQPLLHPLTYNFDEKTVHLFRNGSRFIGNGETFWDQIKYIPFMPAITGMIVLMLATDGRPSHVAFGILFLLAAIVALVGIDRYFSNRKKERELNTIPWFYDAEETAILLRTGKNKSLTVSDLPSRHKTLGIRFQAFKAQVCRPFSQ